MQSIDTYYNGAGEESECEEGCTEGQDDGKEERRGVYYVRRAVAAIVDMRPSTALLLLSQTLLSFSLDKFYPELRSDLQQFQDSSRTILIFYRGYLSTANRFDNNVYFLAKQSKEGEITLTPSSCYSARNSLKFVPYNNTGDLIEETYQVIYTDCETCFVFRNVYANGGYGCALWRRTSTFRQPADCCEFIYDENCGTSPKYQIYLPSCDPALGMPGI
ncbi:hypothetical protein HPB51_006686 [Rhipicephalus microplus]|uniref:Lipocalin n=1 Tax=Rhipicephalus microplus TaxID=6941 RepID=A0A9J6E7E6_RHIMP|nr:hypothetical protein HPB51_006686 [Rhipicephalus microplus]